MIGCANCFKAAQEMGREDSMNCNEVTDTLIEKSASTPLSSQAEEHLSGCQHCQEFVRVLNEPVPVNSPSPEILGQIEQRIVADLRPVRPLAPARYFFAAMVGIFFSIVALVGYRMG